MQRRLDRFTPEGTKDYIFEEMRQKRQIEAVLRSIFEAEGYQEVRTPALEYFDVFTKGCGATLQSELYTLTDSSGNLLALRSDSTKPIARLYASRLKDYPLPLKIYYNQTVFARRNQRFNGKLDEVMQMGVELVGLCSDADKDFVVLCANCMQSLFKNAFLLEINHTQIIQPILQGLNQRTKDALKTALATKNYPLLLGLSEALPQYSQVLQQIPTLVGGLEVLDRVDMLLGRRVEAATTEMRIIWQNLQKNCPNCNVLIDPTVINSYDYYTGVTFKGFVEGRGSEILSGGRYDLLYNDYDFDIPSIGFAINVSEAIGALLGGIK